MTYIPDLSAYNYSTFPRDPKLLAIGWLDSSALFSRGPIDTDFINKLRRLARNRVNLCRGYHYCQFCERDPKGRFLEHHPRGNGEIHVAGVNGITYACPVLISHYIEKHQYRPPDEFLEAVAKSAEPAGKIAIIAALERELWPLIKNWRTNIIRHDGREFTFYESNYAVVVCGGIGSEAARRAAEVVIARYSPEVLISAGVAGALVPELRVGETIFPVAVIDTLDGSRHETAITDAPVAKTALGRTVLASSPEIAGVRQKQQLAKSYGAQAVDMEAGAIAKAAMFHNLPFLAIKSISDELEFELPDMARFIRSGRFQARRFAFYVALRPWLWLRVYRLAHNTHVASDNLCAWLRESALTNTIVGKLNH